MFKFNGSLSKMGRTRTDSDADERAAGMKILVTAPNSDLGRKVLAELLAPEFSVRVMAPRPSCLPEHILEQVELFCGAVDDSTTLCRALDGVEALFWSVPLECLRKTDAQAWYERCARAACAAIRETRTQRVVTISNGGNAVAGPISPACCAVEDILNRSGAAIRHLRCGWFMENFLRQARGICGYGVLSYPLPGDIALPMVAARDVAETILRCLVRRDWTGVRGLLVRGPEDLSFTRVASIIERVLDRPVQFTEIPLDQFIREAVRAGVNVQYARHLAQSFSKLIQSNPRAETRRVDLTAPTTLARWTKDELLPIMKLFSPQVAPAGFRDGLDNSEPEISFP